MIEPLATAGEKILQLFQKVEELEHSEDHESPVGKTIAHHFFLLHTAKGQNSSAPSSSSFSIYELPVSKSFNLLCGSKITIHNITVHIKGMLNT